MTRPVLTLAACLACALTAAAAGAGDLDGLARLSWSPTAVVDTLVVDGPGRHDCWLLVMAHAAPAGFVEAVGYWQFAPGLDPVALEVLTTGTPVGALQPGVRGLAMVRVGDFDCRRGGDPLAVARVVVDVDPAAFSGGRTAITPVAPPAGGATRLTFADYDPVLDCVGQMDGAVIAPVVAVDATVPVRGARFGAWKARYR